MAFNPEWIIGKTVARVEMNPFEANLEHEGLPRSRKKRAAHDPVIYFTDGSKIFFVTEETEVGEYGTDIAYAPAPQKDGSQ